MKAKKHLNLNLQIPLWWPGGSGWRRLARALVPNPGTLIILAVFLLAQSAGAVPVRVSALAGNSTTTISYQGRLADSSGNLVTTSGVGIQFRLYNTDTGGSPLWEESHTAVPVEDGLFHVLLGSTDPIPVSLLANNSTLWLGITVGADSEMAPREQIASVPYAMIASTVPDGSVTTAKLADGAVTQAKLGTDVNLEPPDGSITTAKLANGAVTSAKLEHSGPHIPITPDENGLVKMAVLRQDNTTNTYSKDQVILTGWGWITSDGSDEYVEETVSFGVTFSTPPIVILGNPGRNDNTDPSDISDLTANGRQGHISAHSISTTGFTVWIQNIDIGTKLNNGNRYGYSWIAIGTLE
jgi:hypothetical protein